MSVRIGTQVFARIEGGRKVMEHTDPAGVVRPLEVEFDFEQCGTCGALTLPGDGTHAEWHRKATT